jgi:YD repeat-containing protein
MKHSIFAFFALTFFLFSCKKNHDDVPAGPAAGDIKVKTYTGDYGTYAYSYDSKGRLVLLTRPDGSKSEFDYSNPGKIINKYYFADGNLEGTGEIDLNADGLMIKRVYSDGAPNVGTFDYDANKNIIKKSYTVGGNTTVQDFFYTNGNLDSIRYNLNGNLQYATVFTYYTNKANVLNKDVYGKGYEGNEGKYLLKTEDTRYADGTHSIGEHSYDFDTKGRVTKQTSQKGANIEIALYTYH